MVFEDKKRCQLGWGHVGGGRDSSEGQAGECWDSRMREQACFCCAEEQEKSQNSSLLWELGGKAEGKDQVAAGAGVSPDILQLDSIWVPAGIWMEMSQFMGIAEPNQNHVETLALAKALQAESMYLHLHCTYS